MYKNKKRKLQLYVLWQLLRTKLQKKKINRKTWVKKWIEQRSEQSNVTLLKDLKENNPDDFKNYLRMDDTDFTNLLGK
jgi:RNA binding exosome subunit